MRSKSPPESKILTKADFIRRSAYSKDIWRGSQEKRILRIPSHGGQDDGDEVADCISGGQRRTRQLGKWL
jgi:hypothetical protein